MSQRTMLLAAAGVTAFVLVLIGGLVARAAANAPSPAGAAAVAIPLATVSPAPAAAGDRITPELAATIAGNVAPGARLTKAVELVDFQGAVAYEVTTDRGLIYVEANTGQVLYNGAQPAAQTWSGESEHDDHDGQGGHAEAGDDD